MPNTYDDTGVGEKDLEANGVTRSIGPKWEWWARLTTEAKGPGIYAVIKAKGTEVREKEVGAVLS